MRVLLTGFEAFGGQPVNPSERVVHRLARHSLPGIELHTAILPVDHEQGPAALLDAVEHFRPDAVICLGEAGGRMRISIERVAINLLDDRIPDNAGRQLVDQPIVADGPAAYFCTLPVRRLAAAIQDVGVPVELSLSAGTFLCNQVTYTLLHYLSQQHATCRAGFIHLPFLPEQAVRVERPVASMSLETMTLGLTTALQALAQCS
ncbi:pyroglutamyl-peptidase I [Kallotenue papyrolyticum]|uniref:pyroglutamyl-peptidase I n=1 Tax=Kallotenue papyrolyticum TaxID=1325125 RepID=UPI0004785B14|nr:pyroglutamyl-peptidase I [Kallotenue papyrolyticum]